MLFDFISDAKDSVMAKMSDMRFEHHYNNVMNDKIPKKSSSTSTTKDTYKPASSIKQEETKKPAEEKVEKKSESDEEKNKETYEALEKMMTDFEEKTADLDGVMEDGLKDIVEAVKRFKENKAKSMTNSNVPVVTENDPVKEEHPTDEDESGEEPKEPSKKVIDLKLLDSKHILDVIYQVCFENAEELLKHTVSDEDAKNLSKEEVNKRNKEYDNILLTLIARNLTGLEDVSDVDLEQLEKDLNEKVGEANISGCIQTAFTTFVNSNVPDGKPLDLTKNAPMEIVEEASTESAPVEPEPTANSSAKRGSRRKR